MSTPQPLVPLYEPRDQFVALHHRTMRWACLVVHRRGGKTVACVNELITRATYTQKEHARYAYIAPFYRQAKDVAWQYLKQFGAPFITKIRESELRVELFNGAWITLYGADNPDALRGLYLDGVVLDEYGDCRPSLWGTVVLPTLADRKGWAIFIGTPKGKNHFYEVHKRAQSEQNWFSLLLPASKSGILDQEELGEMRAQMSEPQYLQEMECDFAAAVQGTYYAELITELESRGQLDKEDWVLNQKVKVAFDLGYNDSTAIWFWQEAPDGYHMIDYYEADTKTLGHYFEVLDSKPYEYEHIFLPHDAKAKSLQTGRSTVEQLLAHYRDSGVHIEVIPKMDVQDGIDAVRMILPNVWFSRSRCYEGIEALRAYRRTYDEVKKIFSDKPLHDWSSDGSDAFRIFALASRPKPRPEYLPDRPQPLIQPPRYRLDALFEERESAKVRSYQKLRM